MTLLWASFFVGSAAANVREKARDRRGCLSSNVRSRKKSEPEGSLDM